MVTTIKKQSAAFNDIEKQLNGYYLERADTIRGIMVGLLSNLNVVMVGPPGTAKTDISATFTKHIEGARFFGTTLNPFTTPDEVFGTFDIPLLKDKGLMIRRTEGYLPSAHIVAIEEIFKAGKGMLNSLIEVSHPSRMFSNGPTQEKTPILSMIGTSNELPVGEKDLVAIYDRMIIKMYVQRINDSENFKKMINNSKPYGTPKTTITLEDIATSREMVSDVVIGDQILQRLAVLREELFKVGIYPSDRTGKLSVKALQAQAFLSGRKEVDDDDILFLKHMLWYDPSEEAPVWRAIIDMVKPEYRRLTEILQVVQDSANKALEDNNETEMIAVHKKIRAFIEEAKGIKNSMQRKRRNVEDCNEIIAKLTMHASKLSKRVIGVDSDPNTGDDIY